MRRDAGGSPVSLSALVAIIVLPAGCSLAPRYVRPDVGAPPAFKEAPAPATAGGATWKPARPADTTSSGAWWEIFGDADLGALEAQVDVSSQTVLAAAAQFRQARALALSTRSNLFPTVDLGLSANSRRGSGTASGVTTIPGAGGTTGGGTTSTQVVGGAATSSTVNTVSLPLTVSWEADLFGATRNAARSEIANAQAAAAQVAAVRLQVQAEVASDYWQLRAFDEQLAVLNETVAQFADALKLTRDRFEGGVASEEDVAQAATQLEAAKAQELDTRIARAQFEHALAVLVGKPPAALSVIPVKRQVAIPPVPMALPSELLERRPDIGAAERRVAAANSQIGVQRAAYFPSLTLSGQAGLQNAHLPGLLSLPNRFWAIGATALETLFDGGRRRAGVEGARAAYDAAAANYRQTVLGAFQEVEDNLVAVRVLADEAQAQERALAAARQAQELSNARYVGGVVSYLDVITTQTTVLNRQLAVINTHARQLQDSVLLVKALGGGWDDSMLPSARDVLTSDRPTASRATSR